MNCAHFPVSLRAAIGAAVLSFAIGSRVFAAEQPVGPTIELPKFVVTDSRELPQPEQWRYTTIPGFEILSNASDRSTQQLMRDFQLFRDALSVVWHIPNRSSTPMSLILCARRGKFDEFIPKGTVFTPDATRTSLFLHGPERTAIVIDLEAAVVNVLSTETDDPMSGQDSSQIAVDHNKQLYREYVHYLLSRSQPRLPAWFEEGMAQIVMAMKVDPKFIEFGKLEDPNTVSASAGMKADLNAQIAAQAAGADGGEDAADPDLLSGAPVEDRDFNAALQRKPLMTLQKMFSVQHDSPETANVLGNNRWAKQCYAFVHMCLYGQNGKWQKPFGQFLARAATEPVNEKMFKECFGISYEKMLLEMRGYLDFTAYKSQEYVLKGNKGGLPIPPPLNLREATQSEIGRIKGEALILAGHPEAARSEFIAPYIRGERDPLLLASLGLYERTYGKEDRARKFLEAAVAAKTVQPEAYLALAQMRYADAMAKPEGPKDTFSEKQAHSIIDLLLTARTQPPALHAVYELLADTWAHSAVKPQRADVDVLVNGVRLFPTRLKLVYQTAAFCADVGDIDTAHLLADHGLKYTPDPTGRARFAELKASLPPASSGAMPAHAQSASPASPK
jgi:hypothetical protein